MAKQVLNVGTTNNDKTGDTLRAGGIKIKSNFEEIYAALASDGINISGGNLLKTGDYSDLINKPSFSNVAISGDFYDLSNRPDLGIFVGAPPNNAGVDGHVAGNMAFDGSNLYVCREDYIQQDQFTNFIFSHEHPDINFSLQARFSNTTNDVALKIENASAGQLPPAEDWTITDGTVVRTITSVSIQLDVDNNPYYLCTLDGSFVSVADTYYEVSFQLPAGSYAFSAEWKPEYQDLIDAHVLGQGAKLYVTYDGYGRTVQHIVHDSFANEITISYQSGSNIADFDGIIVKLNQPEIWKSVPWAPVYGEGFPGAGGAISTLQNGTKTLSLASNGTVTISGNIIPDTNIAYDLGSSTAKFRDLYLSGSTITLGDSTISTSVDGSVSFSGGVSATKSVIKVDKLTRTLATTSWSDGVYDPSATDWSPDLPVVSLPVINGRDGSYKFGYKATEDTNITYPDYELPVIGGPAAIGNYTISGTSLGGTSPMNDLVISVNGVTSGGLVAQSTEVSPIGGARAQFELTAGGTSSSDVTHQLISSGTGWPQNIEGFDLTITHGNYTGSLVVHCNAVGTGTFSTYTVVSNTLSYTGSSWYATSISIVSGTPATSQFYQGNTVTLPVNPRSNSDLEVTYYMWWRGDDGFSNGPNNGQIDNYSTPILLDSSSWSITGGVLTVTLPSEFTTHGTDHNGTITVNELNSSGLNFPSGLMGPFASRDVIISDGGMPAQGVTTYVPSEYAVTYDSNDYIVGIDIVNRGYDWLLLDPTLQYNVPDAVPETVFTFGEDSGWVTPTMFTETSTSTLPVAGGTATFSDLMVTGDLVVSGDIHVRPDSIYLGGLKLSTSDNATLLLNDSPISSSGTGDITFNGVKIIGSGTGSGDGYGYSTIELVPDNDLYNITPSGDFGYGGQYLVIDPTSPNHIHIRAGGPQDQAAAQLILGGEKANVTVRDQDNSFTEKHHVIINTQANDSTLYAWEFSNDGSIKFPSLSVDLHNGGVQAGQVLQFGVAGQQVIITGPTPGENESAQRLIVQGQRGNGTGEGGDVYFWGGDANFNGGDIKIYAGDADDATNGSGGYVNIDGGSGFNYGGDVSLTGGNSSEYGGDVILQAGYGAIEVGQIVMQSGSSIWRLASNGALTFPDNSIQETAWTGGRVVTVPTHSTGASGDLEGDLAFSNGYIYYCTADYGQVGHQVSVATAYNGATALNTNSFQLTKSADTLQIAVGDIISDSDGGATSIVDSVSSDDNYTYVGTGSMAYQAVFPLTFTSTDYVSGGNIWKRVAWSNDTW